MITLAALLFSLMDAGTKYLGALLPMVLILWCRYAIQTLVMAGTVLINRGLAGFRTGHLRVQFLRGTMLIMLSVLTFYSLQYLPLAEFTAIIMLSPIFVTVLTSRLSQRPLGPLRWLLILTAFAGTMTVIRPGSALFNIVAAACMMQAPSATATSLQSIAADYRRPCSKAKFSVTRPVPIRAQAEGAWARSSMREEARSFSMRSNPCRWRCKPSSCASCRSAASSALAPIRPSRWTAGSSLRPRST